MTSSDFSELIAMIESSQSRHDPKKNLMILYKRVLSDIAFMDVAKAPVPDFWHGMKRGVEEAILATQGVRSRFFEIDYPKQ